MNTPAIIGDIKDISQLFFDQCVRCEQMIPIYMCMAGRPSEALISAIFEDFDVCDLLGIPRTVNCVDEVMDILRDNHKIGYLARFSTPSNSHGHSWGVYQSKWFYSHDIEALELMALGWASNFHTVKEVFNG